MKPADRLMRSILGEIAAGPAAAAAASSPPPSDGTDPELVRALIRKLQAKLPPGEVVGTKSRQVLTSGVMPQIENVSKEGPFRDAFEAQVDALDAAAVGPNGERLDEFYQHVNRLGNVTKELNQSAKFVRNVPASAVGSLLGSYQTVTMRKPAVQVCSWISDSDIEVIPVTVTLSAVNYKYTGTPSGVVGPLRPYAIVTFGGGINRTEVEVDVGRGCQFTVGTNNIAVQVALDDNPNIVYPSALPSMQLGASLAFGRIVRTPAVTRTVYIDSLGANTTTTVLVPQFAKSVCWYGQGGTTNTSTILSFQDLDDWVSGLGVGRGQYFANLSSNASEALAATMTTPISLSSDIIAVAVKNGEGASAISGKLVFQLAI